MSTDATSPGYRQRPGMTFIEILVVLTLVAGIMLASLSVITLLSFGALESSSLRITGAIEQTYGRSAINGQRYQLVIDIDSNEMWAECSEVNVPLPSEVMTGSLGVRFGEEGSDDLLDAEPFSDPFNLSMYTQFDDCTDSFLPRQSLEGDVVFDSVMTTHQRQPFVEGIATIGFFPDGFVEPSIIWIREGDADSDNVITLRIEPMTGAVSIEPGRMEIPDDFLDIEEDG